MSRATGTVDNVMSYQVGLENRLRRPPLCLDRLATPRKDAPISTPLPIVKTAQDALEASATLLAAVSAGEVTPDEGGRVMALLTAHKGIIETADLDARIAALEGRVK
jgi:hypothetical protein